MKMTSKWIFSLEKKYFNHTIVLFYFSFYFHLKIIDVVLFTSLKKKNIKKHK